MYRQTVPPDIIGITYLLGISDDTVKPELIVLNIYPDFRSFLGKYLKFFEKYLKFCVKVPEVLCKST